jgi:hypothetical protein
MTTADQSGVAHGRATALLLTATVLPATPVVRADPQVRMADYLRALSQWWSLVRELPIDIVFVENSGYDIGPVHRQIALWGAASRIHVDQYVGDAERMRRLGKGAGELDLMDRFVADGRFQRYQYFVKCTGRLFVKNAAALISRAWDDEAEFAIALRSDLAFADTRFFIVHRDIAIRYLSGLGDDIRDDEGIYMETLVARQLLQLLRDGRTWHRFDRLPRYVGVGGTYGRRHAGALAEVRYQLKAVLHMLAHRFGQHLFL